MCRLMAFAASAEVTPSELFDVGELEAHRALSTLHADGWGFATSPANSTEFDTYKSTLRAIDDDTFLDVTQSSRAEAGIIHLRWASAGMEVDQANTHPFIGGEWAFAHNGSIPDSERLLDLLDPEFASLRRGTTDSELYFLLVRQEINAAGDVTEGVHRAVARLRTVAPVASLNAVLLGPAVLVVVHAHDRMENPLVALANACVDQPIPPLHRERYFDLQWRRSDNSVVVAHAGLPGAGWQDIPQNSMIVIDRGSLVARVVGLDDSTVGASAPS